MKHLLLFLLVFVVNNNYYNVESFSIPKNRVITRRQIPACISSRSTTSCTTTTTALQQQHAASIGVGGGGGGVTNSYLDGLSSSWPTNRNVVDHFSTTDYLNSLSQLRDWTTTTTTMMSQQQYEEYQPKHQVFVDHLSQWESINHGISGGAIFIADNADNAEVIGETTTSSTESVTTTMLSPPPEATEAAAATILPTEASTFEATVIQEQQQQYSAPAEPAVGDGLTASVTTSPESSFGTSAAADPFVDPAGTSTSTVASSILDNQQQYYSSSDIDTTILPDTSNAVLDSVASQPPAPPNNLVEKFVDRLADSLTGAADGVSDSLGTVRELAQSQLKDNSGELQEYLKTSIGTQVEKAGEYTIADVASGVFKGIQGLVTFIGQVLNWFMKTAAGTQVNFLVDETKSAVQTLFEDATKSISTTLQGIGQESVSEAAQSLVKLLVLVSKVLFAIVSGFIKIVSGKNINEWSIVAKMAVQNEANELLTEATNTANDISHKSLNELTNSIESFSRDITIQVSNLVEQAASSNSGATVDGASSTGAGALFLDGTAAQQWAMSIANVLGSP